MALDAVAPGGEQAKLSKAIHEFDSYLRANAGRIPPNYGERRRAGEAISTAFTESTVNQVISKRMIKKTTDALDPRGAHLTPRSKPESSTTNSTDDFHRWYLPHLHPHPGSCDAPGIASSPKSSALVT